MAQRSWTEFLSSLAPQTAGRLVLRERLTRLQKAPDIYWYPGCGSDLSPLILDVPNNPTGERLYRVNATSLDQAQPIVLWMNDYSSYQPGFPRPGPIQVSYDRVSAAFRWEISRDDRWRGWNQYDTALEIHRHQERYLFEDELPLTFFTVTVKNRNQGIHTRPDLGDKYLVIYSNCASHELLRRVLLPFGIRPRCVALIRQGGFSGQLHYEQYIELPAWLAEREADLGGPVDLYVIDAYGQDLKFKRPLSEAIAHYDYRGGPVPWGWSPCRAFGRPGLQYQRSHKAA
jgi:hypothetical protein